MAQRKWFQPHGGPGSTWLPRLLVPVVLVLFAAGGCVTSQQQAALNYQDPVMYQNVMPGSTSLHAPEPEASGPPTSYTGSLWASRDESLYQDLKAHKVGDIVTIVVSEQASASNKGATEFGRESDYKGEGKFLGFKAADKMKAKPFETGYDGKFSNTYKGSGKTTKDSSMTAYMSARVIRILPEGNLVIRGSRWTKVNQEMQQIVLEGIVRPTDISRNNTVLSQNIADAKIFFVGKGPVTQHQGPGWLGQLTNILAPF